MFWSPKDCDFCDGTKSKGSSVDLKTDEFYYLLKCKLKDVLVTVAELFQQFQDIKIRIKSSLTNSRENFTNYGKNDKMHLIVKKEGHLVFKKMG